MQLWQRGRVIQSLDSKKSSVMSDDSSIFDFDTAVFDDGVWRYYLSVDHLHINHLIMPSASTPTVLRGKAHHAAGYQIAIDDCAYESCRDWDHKRQSGRHPDTLAN